MVSSSQVSHPGRRAALPALATAALVVLTGCGTGFNSQTLQPYDPGVGANERTGAISVLGALVVDNGDGTGTLSATLVGEPGTEAELTDVVAETLDGEPIDAELSGSFTVTSQTQRPQKLGDAEAEPGETAIVTLTGDTFAAGDFVDLTLTFSDAAPFEVQVPVVTRTDDGTYDAVAPAPA